METYRIRNQNYLVQLHVHICAEVVINLLELSRCSFLALLRRRCRCVIFPASGSRIFVFCCCCCCVFDYDVDLVGRGWSIQRAPDHRRSSIVE